MTTMNALFAPQTFAELVAMTERLAATTFVPEHFRGKPHEILAAVMYGAELNLSPMQSLQSLFLTHGKVSMPVDLMLAMVLRSGQLVSHDRGYDETTKTGWAKVHRQGRDEKTYSFGEADAKKVAARENNKDITLDQKHMYRSYPQRMYPARAMGFALRDEFGDILKGLFTVEEMRDVEPPSEARTVVAATDPDAVPESWAWVPVELRETVQKAFVECHTTLAQQRVLLNRFKVDGGAEALVDHLKTEWAARNHRRRIRKGEAAAAEKALTAGTPSADEELQSPAPREAETVPGARTGDVTAADIPFGGAPA